MKKAKAVLSVLLVMLLVCSAVPAGFALSGNVPHDIAEKTKAIAVEAEAEGMVLLKNEENTLPLGEKGINVFGAGSVCPFLGGAGSGAITTDDPVDFYDALDETGVSYNKELFELYEKHCSGNSTPKTDSTVMNNLLQLILAKSSLKEMDVKYLTDEVMNRALEFSDTAVVMISRTSAEGSDIPADTLRISDSERALLDRVCSVFGKVIILFNTGNVMEMGFLDEYESIKAAAMLWIPGEYGMLAAAGALKGDINPSGRLADTVAVSPESHPSSECFGTHKYDGGGYYVQYLEGIYVGYRYFETFAKDKVRYPFGYGLSYTSFEKELVNGGQNGEDITASVRVTNTGSVPGKETVQIYYSAPYYEGGIEKSAVCLGGFAKTKELAPGESCNVTVSFSADSMASFDTYGAGCWKLEKGEYRIILGENAREEIDSFSVNISEDKVIGTDPASGNEIKPRFADAYNGFPVLSRNDPEGTYPVFEALTADEAVKKSDKKPAPVKDGEKPKTGVKHSGGTITLRDVYENEELLEDFLDQMTLDEMIALTAHSGYETQGIERLGIPKTFDNDGPSCVKGRNGILYVDCGTAYPCETAIACTWNTDLAEKLGAGVGEEAKAIGTDIWYAPGANIHRSPMGGRNFEYFSEDPLISGKMAAAIVRGAESEGLITTIKHFALNDQESHRNGLYTWANEQTMREIYLKAFEIAVKEGGCDGIMSAYSRIGAKWCGACPELLKDVLRTEWGFDGYVISDYSSNFTGAGYMSPVLAVYSENDTMLTGIWSLQSVSHIPAMKLAYYADPVGFGTALRDACRNICRVKMKTTAFLDPSEYDASLFGALQSPEDWSFESPYVFSALRYLLNNLLNVVLWAARVIF